MADTLQIRPAVLKFAATMELKLRTNDHKPGWEHKDDEYCLRRARQELEELQEASDTANFVGIIEEAADVANFVMMMSDNAMHALADEGR